MSEPDTASPLTSFFAELRRRRVVRVAVVYAIAGWVVIEVASVVMPGLHLPDWTVTLVIALVVLGFPIAFMMGWMFDLGPKGVQRTGPTVATTAIEAAPAAVPSEAPKPSARAGERRRTIAVLPFVNMSSDAENEYFSDGISEEILNLLTKLPQLKVASRTSSFNFKGKEVDIPTVARQLGVGTVLEGSVRRAGDRVRITAQLIDADSDSHLWSETYDREFKDVFAIQDDIAQSIVKAMQVTLTPKERRVMQFVATTDAEAYDYYLRGRNYMHSMTRRGFEHAIRMYKQAIERDPTFGQAYAGMADAYSYLYRFAEATPENAASANRASEEAVLLDSDSAEGHASRGVALQYVGGKFEEAQREFETAIALNPNRAETYYEYGRARASQGQFEEAAQLYLKASELNPADFQPPMLLAQTYASLGRKQDEMKVMLDSLDLVERHIKLNPHDTRALYMMALILGRVGERDRAIALAEQALTQGHDEPFIVYNVACFYALQGDKQRALDLLENAVKLGFGDRAWIETDSDFESLRQEPRFKALLLRVS